MNHCPLHSGCGLFLSYGSLYDVVGLCQKYWCRDMNTSSAHNSPAHVMWVLCKLPSNWHSSHIHCFCQSYCIYLRPPCRVNHSSCITYFSTVLLLMVSFTSAANRSSPSDNPNSSSASNRRVTEFTSNNNRGEIHFYFYSP